MHYVKCHLYFADLHKIFRLIDIFMLGPPVLNLMKISPSVIEL